MHEMSVRCSAARRALISLYRQAHSSPTNHQRHNFATAAATTPSPSMDYMIHGQAPVQRYPPSKPPSHKPPEIRKSQLHRQYTSMLLTSPLILLFQHNNLTASEWAAIRKELTNALRKTSAASGDTTGAYDPAENVRLQIIQTGIFAAALRVVEFYKAPSNQGDGEVLPHEQHAQVPSHLLSKAAHRATFKRRRDGLVAKRSHPLHALLSGPVAILTFPAMSPAHLAAALRNLSPTPGSGSAFPAPRRRDAPGYYETPVQGGLQKLLLLGARVEGKAMDGDAVRWIGGLAARGGLEGLRAEVVALLQGVGMGLVGGLQSIGTGVWGTIESRRLAMEEEGKGNN